MGSDSAHQRTGAAVPAGLPGPAAALLRRRRQAAANHDGKSAEAVRSILPQVREAIEARGPLSSLDLEMGEMVDWDWSQSQLARAALESIRCSRIR